MEIVTPLCFDEIVNIRLNVGQVFGNVIGILGEIDLEFIVNVLETQIQEEKTRPNGGDRDVYYFSKQAIRMAQDRLKQCSMEHL